MLVFHTMPIPVKELVTCMPQQSEAAMLLTESPNNRRSALLNQTFFPAIEIIYDWSLSDTFPSGFYPFESVDKPTEMIKGLLVRFITHPLELQMDILERKGDTFLSVSDPIDPEIKLNMQSDTSKKGHEGKTAVSIILNSGDGTPDLIINLDESSGGQRSNLTVGLAGDDGIATFYLGHYFEINPQNVEQLQQHVREMINTLRSIKRRQDTFKHPMQ